MRTHASFFSGVGGLDMGLEAAGWSTVSFSEIDPYASAVLARHWPGVPNLGSIVDLAGELRLAAGSLGVRGPDGRDDAAVHDEGSGEPDCNVAPGRPDADGDRPGRDVDDRPQARDEVGRLDGGGDARGRDLPRRTRADGDRGGDGDPRPRADAPGGGQGVGSGEQLRQHAGSRSADWTTAFLWTGGFPCQDLSVAGKRRGMGTHADRADTRSGLAYAFLDLVERHRPPAIILENVPGLLSSHAGRDFGSLLGRLGELGYWWAYRVLDARYFGVPQRRRRVFIVAIHARLDPVGDGPAEVLSVGSRCDRHPATGGQAGPNAADGVGAGISRALSTSQERLDADTESFVVANGLRASDGHHGHGSPRGDGGDNLVVGASPDPDRMREADGMAGRLDDRAGVAFVKGKRASSPTDDESWRADDVAPTLNSFDPRDRARAGSGRLRSAGRPIVSALDTMQPPWPVHRPRGRRDKVPHTLTGLAGGPDPLLPDGLDSHRYRCCGNGVVAPVAEFIGERLRDVCERLLAEHAA